MKNYSYDGKTINLNNTTGNTLPSGEVVLVGNGWYAIPVADIPDDGYGAAAQCGVFKFAVPGGTTLAPGDDYNMILATQVYDAGTGVTIGRVMEQVGQTAHVLLNSMSGGVR